MSLTKWQILAAGKPAGFRMLADFMAEFDAGEIPATAATRYVRAVLQRILAGEPADQVLGLRAKRGRPRRSPAREPKYYKPLRQFIAKYIRDNPGRGAVDRAKKAAAAEFSKSEDQVGKIWGPHAALNRSGPVRDLAAAAARHDRDLHGAAAAVIAAAAPLRTPKKRKSKPRK